MRLPVLSLFARLARVLEQLHLSRVNRWAKEVLRRVTRDTLLIRAHGLEVEGSVDSWSILYRIGEGAYEPFQLRLFKTYIRPGTTVLDIGANVGFYSLLAAREAGDNGEVYAFRAGSPERGESDFQHSA